MNLFPLSMCSTRKRTLLTQIRQVWICWAIQGMNCLVLSIPDVDADLVVVLLAHKQLLSGENIVNYEHQLRRKDGMIITVLNNSRPLTDAEGDIIGMQSTLIDITERKEAEEALRKAHGELEQRVEERTAELAKANDQLKQEIEERKLAEKEREKLINELQKAIKEIKTLRGILPRCSFCKKIRDDKGYWEQVDVYIHKHLQADISHGICPACAKEHYPDLDIHE